MSTPTSIRSEFFGDQLEEDSEILKKVSTAKHAGPFLIGKELGRGITGSVRLGIHADTGFKVALKIIKKKYLNKNPERWNTLRREIAVMKITEHPNIVKLYDVFETYDKIYLVTELLTGGELFDYIPREGLSRHESLRILAQITSALLHCHEYGIVHRDLKPENLLMDDHHNVKLGDFGMARLMKEGVMLKTSCGSPHYASPEVIADGKYDGKRSDVWSIGVILFAMATGMLPFDHQNIPTLLNMVKKGEYEMPDSLDDDVKDLVDRMIQVDLTKRIRMEDILHHPALRKTHALYSPGVFHSPFASPRGSPIPSGSLGGSPVSSPSSRTRTLDSDGDMKMVDREAHPSLDDTLLEDLLSLGWDSREELCAKILQPEPSQEKSLYNHLKRRRRTRIEELHRLSPLPPRRRFYSFSQASSSPVGTPTHLSDSLSDSSRRSGPPSMDFLPPTGFPKNGDVEMSTTTLIAGRRVNQPQKRPSSVPSSPYSPPAFLTRQGSEPSKSFHSPKHLPGPSPQKPQFSSQDASEVSLKLFSLANSRDLPADVVSRPTVKPTCARLLFPTSQGSGAQRPQPAQTADSRRGSSIPDRVSTVILSSPKAVFSPLRVPQKTKEESSPPRSSPATPVSRWFSAFFRRRPSLDPWRGALFPSPKPDSSFASLSSAPSSGSSSPCPSPSSLSSVPFSFASPFPSPSPSSFSSSSSSSSPSPSPPPPFPSLSSSPFDSPSSVPSYTTLGTPTPFSPSSDLNPHPTRNALTLPLSSPTYNNTYSLPVALSRERSSSLPNDLSNHYSKPLPLAVSKLRNSPDLSTHSRQLPRKKEPRPSNRANSAYIHNKEFYQELADEMPKVA